MNAKYETLYSNTGLFISSSENQEDAIYQEFKALEVRPDDEVSPQELLLEIDGIPILHRGEMLTIYGPPKSRKSRFTTALGSSSIGKGMLGITPTKPDFKVNIYDTEQGQEHFISQLRTLFEGAGHKDYDRVKAMRLRGFRHWNKVLSLIERHIVETRPDLVIVDASADLLSKGVLDPEESTKLVREWEQLMNRYQFAYVNVQHSAKSSPNSPRGHFGSESTRRSETVISINLSQDNRMISLLQAGETRNEPFNDMLLMVDQHTGQLCRVDLGNLQTEITNDKGRSETIIPESWDLEPSSFALDHHKQVQALIMGNYPSLKEDVFRQKLARFGDRTRKLSQNAVNTWMAYYLSPGGGLTRQGEYILLATQGDISLPFG